MMIALLIISNLIFIGLWLLTLRNTRRKSLLLESDFKWRKSGNTYEYSGDGSHYSFSVATRKQKLTADCYRLGVPQPENKYLTEGWKDED